MKETTKQVAETFNIHGNITFPIILLLAIIFLWVAREWLGKALSETQADGKRIESSKRLVLFIIAITYAICSIMIVFKTGQYDVKHKLVDACLILLLAGVTTLPQLVMLYRKITGKGDDKDDPPPSVVTETTTKTTTQ